MVPITSALVYGAAARSRSAGVSAGVCTARSVDGGVVCPDAGHLQRIKSRGHHVRRLLSTTGSAVVAALNKDELRSRTLAHIGFV